MSFEVTGKVELFPQASGWHYIKVPAKYTEMFKDIADRGLIPIEVTLGNTKWETSLLPMGDGTHFIALKAKVRKSEGIELGDKISLTFKPRGL